MYVFLYPAPCFPLVDPAVWMVNCFLNPKCGLTQNCWWLSSMFACKFLTCRSQIPDSCSRSPPLLMWVFHGLCMVFSRPDRLVEPCQEFFMGCLRLGGNARGLELGKVLQDVWLGGEMEIHGFPVKWSQKTWLFPYIYIYILICIYIYIYVYNWPDFALVQSIPMVMNGTILGRSDIFRGKYLLHGEHGHCFFFQSWQPDSVDDADRTSNGSSVARANSKTL